MSLSLVQQSEDLYDQIAILVGSAIRLLRGEAGVFVVSNEAFDPLSSTEYTVYRLDDSGCARLLAFVQDHDQPDMAHPQVVDAIPGELVSRLGMIDVHVEEEQPARFERCSMLVHDHAGVLGRLHYVRQCGAQSCFEAANGEQEALPLFIAHLAAGIRSALKTQVLLKEQNRLAAIFQQSAEGILTVDTQLRIVDFNPAMERLTGWLESEVLGKHYYETLRPQDRQGNEPGTRDSLFARALTAQSNVHQEMVMTTRDGQRFDVFVTASYVRSSRGEPIGGILTMRDISREREQEEQRSTFISVISHELQTPIAIIKGYASTLARPDATLEPETLRSRLQAIEEEADSLNKMVGNLLYASRIQAGGLQMEIAPLDLSSLVQKVALRLRVKSPEVTVKLDLPAHLPTVMADRDRIEEVLQNLLDNAIKYSPKRRVVTVSCRSTSDEVIVSVSDVGMGISLRDQERIFERFHRVGNSLSSSTQGAGLGLYICRAIVEAHGGYIRVESILHQGSTFSFSLPREEKAHVPMVVF
ncbi:MAG TPA: ATP-binding protein [Ktedonobacteraceae bacterium]|nr:ATP-binding protein [Ktedonobacteraceae bacterium]